MHRNSCVLQALSQPRSRAAWWSSTPLSGDDPGRSGISLGAVDRVVSSTPVGSRGPCSACPKGVQRFRGGGRCRHFGCFVVTRRDNVLFSLYAIISEQIRLGEEIMNSLVWCSAVLSRGDSVSLSLSLLGCRGVFKLCRCSFSFKYCFILQATYTASKKSVGDMRQPEVAGKTIDHSQLCR